MQPLLLDGEDAPVHMSDNGQESGNGEGLLVIGPCGGPEELIQGGYQRHAPIIHGRPSLRKRQASLTFP
jgi:hypothetical protein